MPGPSPHDLQFMKALKAHKQGRRAEARALLEAILEESPDHSDSLEILGKLLEEDGDLDRAIELTERLRALRPDSIMAHANLSRYWMLKGDKETAEMWQAKARVLGWREEVARKGQDPDEVTGGGGDALPDPELLTRQEKAVEDDPESIVARMALANSYRRLGMPIKAVGQLREALKRDETMSVLYLELGSALEESNLKSEALEVYEKGAPIAERRGDLMPRNRMQVRIQALRKALAGETT